MRSIALLAVSSILTACLQASPDSPLVAALPASPCRTSGLDDLVGQVATAALRDDALRRSGAHTARWIAPETAVTRDFREDRLNGRVDARNVVTAFDCG